MVMIGQTNAVDMRSSPYMPPLDEFSDIIPFR